MTALTMWVNCWEANVKLTRIAWCGLQIASLCHFSLYSYKNGDGIQHYPPSIRIHNHSLISFLEVSRHYIYTTPLYIYYRP